MEVPLSHESCARAEIASSAETALASIPAVQVLGVRIHILLLDALLDFITQIILSRRRALIAHVNVYGLNLAYQLPWFCEFLNRADLVFCDGFGAQWGARLAGLPIPLRNTPADWIECLCQRCVEHDLSIFFLGAKPGVAEQAAARLKHRFPPLRIAGTHHGYFDQTASSPENATVIQCINAVRPDLLLVGMGMPLQERWLAENWDQLEAHVALIVGGVFDIVSGELRRPPRWMTDHGLEWLGRLMIEPRRLWRRYLLGNPLFFWRVLQQRMGWHRHEQFEQ